jgi:ribosome modulation factor
MATQALRSETDAERADRIFNEGQAACRAGKSNIDNPYTDDGDMEAWNDGWFDQVDAEAEATERGWDW